MMGLDPVSIAGMGLQLMGTLAQKQAQEDERDQRTRRMAQEADTQTQIAGQNAARVAQAANQVSAQQQQANQKDTADKMATDYAPTATGYKEATYDATTAGAPKEISDSMAGQLAKAVALGKSYAKSKANLSSLGWGDTGANIAIGRSGTDVGLNNNRAQGSWGVMQQDLNSIYPDQNKMLGADLANGIGSGLFMYGAKRKVIPDHSRGIDESGMY